VQHDLDSRVNPKKHKHFVAVQQKCGGNTDFTIPLCAISQVKEELCGNILRFSRSHCPAVGHLSVPARDLLCGLMQPIQEYAMQIQIDNPNTPAMTPSEWRSLVERRVRFVMRRLRSEITHVHIRLVDVNRPRGGVDQLCQLKLDTEAHGKVVVTAIQNNAPAALNAALRRAARTLVRQWQRRRRPVRPTLRMGPDLQAI
jgi:hypothetical protein